MRNRLPFHSSLFALLILTAGTLTLAPRAKPKPSPQYAGQRNLYAAYHLQGEATLTVSNSTMHQVTATIIPVTTGRGVRSQV